MLGALAISLMQQLDISINNRYEYRLHSASSIQIPQSTNRYNSMLPSVYVSPLKLHSATKNNLHGVSDSALFRNHLKVRLSPLKSPVLRNSKSKYRRSVVYPSIS